MLEAIHASEKAVEENKEKHLKLYKGNRKVLVYASWPAGAGVDQQTALDHEEKEFAIAVAAYNQKCEAVEEGYDHVPFSTLDFGGVSWLMSLAYDCPMIRIGGRLNSEPLLYTASEAYRVTPREQIYKYGLYPVIAERMSRFQERYPKIPLNIPDNQSPVDVLTCIMKSEAAIYGMFDQPEAIHYLLNIITGSIIEVNRFFEKHLRHFGGFASGLYQPFGMHVSDDNAAFLSPDTYREFAQPYVERLGEEFGGINFHCCMGYTQNLPVIASVKGFMGFDPQVDFNPMDKTIQALEGRGGVWKVSNVPWQKNADLPHDDEAMFREAIDRTEGICGLLLNVFGDSREEALVLAYKVKDYAIKRGRNG